MLERRTGIPVRAGTRSWLSVYVEHAGQHGAAAGENAAGAQRFDHAALAQALFHEVEELARARLQDLRDQAQRQHLRLAGWRFRSPRSAARR